MLHPQQAAPTRLHRHRCAVLVVDDVSATRNGLAELLRLRGYDTYEAGNGAEALTQLRAHDDIAVVVLDLWMPGTNGFWFRQHQRADPAIADVPVIVFTGSAHGQALDGFDAADVLLKPFSVDELLDAVQRACEH